MGLPVVFAELAKAEARRVRRGDKAEEAQVTPLDIAVSFLEGLPKIVPYGELYRGASVPATSFSEGGSHSARPAVSRSIRTPRS